MRNRKSGYNGKMNVSLLIMLVSLSTPIQMCQVNGVPTYTDRSDICDEPQAVELDGGTFSMVEAFEAPPTAEPKTQESKSDEKIVIEHRIPQPIYIYEPQPVLHTLGYRPRVHRQHPGYPYLPDLTPSLYRDRVGHATMPHQQSPILGKRYQSGRNPARRPPSPLQQWPASDETDQGHVRNRRGR
jgi:hypothetical protein